MTRERNEFIYRTAPMLGLTEEQARIVLRKAQTLHTWAVHECNGTIQEEQVQNDAGQWIETGRFHWHNPNTGNKCGSTSNREAGAVKALQDIAAAAGLAFEHQGDPRGYVVKLAKDGRFYGVPSRG